MPSNNGALKAFPGANITGSVAPSYDGIPASTGFDPEACDVQGLDPKGTIKPITDAVGDMDSPSDTCLQKILQFLGIEDVETLHAAYPPHKHDPWFAAFVDDRQVTGWDVAVAWEVRQQESFSSRVVDKPSGRDQHDHSNNDSRYIDELPPEPSYLSAAVSSGALRPVDYSHLKYWEAMCSEDTPSPADCRGCSSRTGLQIIWNTDAATEGSLFINRAAQLIEQLSHARVQPFVFVLSLFNSSKQGEHRLMWARIWTHSALAE
jgi:hypothetical protein